MKGTSFFFNTLTKMCILNRQDSSQQTASWSFTIASFVQSICFPVAFFCDWYHFVTSSPFWNWELRPVNRFCKEEAFCIFTTAFFYFSFKLQYKHNKPQFFVITLTRYHRALPPTGDMPKATTAHTQCELELVPATTNPQREKVVNKMARYFTCLVFRFMWPSTCCSFRNVKVKCRR